MAVIFGTKESGVLGALDDKELATLIERKSGGRADDKNCKKCAEYIIAKNKTTDGGGITTKFAGRSVFHISHGVNGGSDGCSVFFTLSADQGDKLVAGIVGVGWHAAGSDHVYKLDWGKGPPFFTGGRLDTSKQKQKGNK